MLDTKKYSGFTAGAFPPYRLSICSLEGCILYLFLSYALLKLCKLKYVVYVVQGQVRDKVMVR